MGMMQEVDLWLGVGEIDRGRFVLPRFVELMLTPLELASSFKSFESHLCYAIIIFKLLFS